MSSVWTNKAGNKLLVVAAAAVPEAQRFDTALNLQDYRSNITGSVNIYALNLPNGPRSFNSTQEAANVRLSLDLAGLGVVGYEIELE
jgi:hypothetical protein